MKQLIKMEMKRAFISWPYFFVLLIGILISILHVKQEIMPSINFDYPRKEGDPLLTPWTRWIGFEYTSFTTNLLYLLLPILAAIPFGDSYYLDQKSGYLKGIMTRSSKGNYLLSKYFVTFISGGSVILIPLMINFLICSWLLPNTPQDPTWGNAPLVDSSMWVDLYYEHPYLYVSRYLAIDFVFAGTLAIICLAVSVAVKKQFAVLLAPFMVYLVMFVIFPLAGLEQYSPFLFLKPGQGVIGLTVTKIITIWFPLWMLSSLIFFTGAWKSEAY
ncbi:hypothetical protein [Neobacillus sp. PS2-9]|uniref:hypothetical protein n=1 Tax=Neobacillus sp. PS2-9 TaxID=3070676 RepID=UPI0027DFD69A|nr:hypothetical protein [Neobacillus sp. PS2-9]WML58717.1 hypothetical protein RCG25_02675 [Neobacillus sp. PS2-9]